MKQTTFQTLITVGFVVGVVGIIGYTWWGLIT